MIRFITTSPSFAGEVHIIYGDDNQLLCIDFRNAQLNSKQTSYLYQHTPIIFDATTFAQSFGTPHLTFVHEAYTITFDEWWHRYDRKINRVRAEKLWARLSKADQLQAYTGILAYQRHLQHNTWKTKADPETYLRNKYWTNEWK